MKKWAYTYEIARHEDCFVGPFESYDKMMESIVSLVADEVMGDRIQD